MIQQAIHNIIEGQDLSFQAAKEVMNEIMSGKTTPAPVSYTHLDVYKRQLHLPFPAHSAAF